MADPLRLYGRLMTIIEKKVWVNTGDEKDPKPELKTIGFELYGASDLPKELNYPVRVKITGCRPFYMNCSHQDGDVFLGHPLTFWTYLRLRWHRLWNKKQYRQIEHKAEGKTNMPITRKDDGREEKDEPVWQAR